MMTGKGKDRAQGLAERSINTSIVPPTENSQDPPEHDDYSDGTRSLIGNDQREGLEKTDPGDPKSNHNEP